MQQGTQTGESNGVWEQKESSGFEGMIHLQHECAHDGGEGDLGGLAGGPQPLVKLSQGAVFHPRHGDRRHVKAASHLGPAPADVPLAFPRAKRARAGGRR